MSAVVAITNEPGGVPTSIAITTLAPGTCRNCSTAAEMRAVSLMRRWP
jgi:hypothetical protein